MIKKILLLYFISLGIALKAQEVSFSFISTHFLCNNNVSVSGSYSPDSSTFLRYKKPNYLTNIENAATVTGFLDGQIVLDANENVWVWGQNQNYSLGLGHDSLVEKPMINPMLSGTKKIGKSSTEATKYAIKGANNELWGWGRNNFTLANYEEEFAESPIYLGLDSVMDIAAGESNAIALKSDGSVWVWGKNNNKQMGIDSVNFSLKPLEVKQLPDIAAISSDYLSSVVIDSTGQAWGWGVNFSGNLGKDEFQVIGTPVKIEAMKGVKQVACMRGATLWTDSAGTAWGMGQNFNGQLGVDDKVERDTAVPQIIELPAPVEILFAAQFSAMALLENGELWAWGDNQSSKLGIGDRENQREFLPVKVFDPCTVVNSINDVLSKTLNLYPNPSASGSFTIENLPLNAHWEIYDAQGQKVMMGNKRQIDLQNYKKGLYILRWYDGKQQGSVKLMYQ